MSANLISAYSYINLSNEHVQYWDPHGIILLYVI